jgi:hypothetical protein
VTNDPGSDDEARLRGKFRVIAVCVLLALLVFLVGADTLGRLFIDKSFHVGDVVYGSLIGALMLLLGVETAARFPGGKR